MSETHDTRALAIIPKTIGEVTALAEQLSKSELLPKELRGKMANVLVTILAGQEMGLSPMASLRNFHVIEGKPVLGSDGMVALVLGSGKSAYFRRVDESETSVTYETMRIGDDKPRRCTWTKDMVKVAGLNTKDNHRLYPRAMLAARAKAELARDVYPDVLAGCYAPEEAADWERPEPDAVDAEFVEKPADDDPVPHEILALDHTKNEAEVKEMGPVLAKLPQKWRAKANDAYKARLNFHREQPAETKAEGAA